MFRLAGTARHLRLRHHATTTARVSTATATLLFAVAFSVPHTAAAHGYGLGHDAHQYHSNTNDYHHGNGGGDDDHHHHQYSTMAGAKSEDEWRMQLTPEQFRVLRQKGTERAGTGEYNKHYPDSGTYNCAGCDAPLFTAKHKFDSGCGWPAFYDNIPGAVKRNPDADGRRVEIVCANCGGHLGHVFKGERFNNPVDERHCVNSVSISFKEAAE